MLCFIQRVKARSGPVPGLAPSLDHACLTPRDKFKPQNQNIVIHFHHAIPISNILIVSSGIVRICDLNDGISGLRHQLLYYDKYYYWIRNFFAFIYGYRTTFIGNINRVYDTPKRLSTRLKGAVFTLYNNILCLEHNGYN